MIQGSINQLLGLTTVMAKLDPGSEKRAAIYENKQQIKGLEKQAAQVSSKQKPVEQETTGALTAELELADEIVSATGERFKLQPTEKNLESYKRNIETAENEFRRPIKAELAERAAKEALAEEQRRVGKQRVREFKENAPAPTAGKRGTIKYDNI